MTATVLRPGRAFELGPNKVLRLARRDYRVANLHEMPSGAIITRLIDVETLEAGQQVRVFLPGDPVEFVTAPVLRALCGGKR